MDDGAGILGLAMLQKLQKIILPRQKVIVQVLFGLEVVLLAGWLVAAVLVSSQPQLVMPVVVRWGGRLGVIAALLFVTTLLPGIIMRLRSYAQALLPVATLITPFRRHLGILMFLTAFVHMSFTTTLPYVAFSGWRALPPPMTVIHLAGSVAWLLLLPIWLTSNDLSMKRLGKNWKRLQRFTYVAIWFVFGHLVLVGSPLAWLVIAVAGLEVVSWLKVGVAAWRKQ